MSANKNNTEDSQYVVWIETNLCMGDEADWEQNSKPKSLQLAMEELIDSFDSKTNGGTYPATILPLGVTPRSDGLFSNPETDPD